MKLFVQGFRSVAEGQYIDLGEKITFLVGPNSSGKSTIIAAIELINKELGKNPFHRDIPVDIFWKNQLENSIVSWLKLGSSDAHAIFSDLNIQDIYKNPNKENVTAGISSIGLLWGQETERSLIFSRISAEKSIFEVASLNALDFFYVTDEETEDHSFHTKFSCYEGDSLLFEEVDSLAALGLILIFPFNSEKTDIEKIAEWLLISLNKIQQANGGEALSEIFEIVKNLVTQGIAERRLYWSIELLRLIIPRTLSGKERQRSQNEIQKYHSILMKHRKNILKQYSSAPNIHHRLISAERHVPRSEHLKKILDQNSFSDDDISMLMASAIDRDWPEWAKEGLDLESQKLIDNVNRAFSTHLFSDSGYQIVVESKILLPRDCLEEMHSYGEVHLENKEFYCELSLIDCHGRKLNFSEVGAGIGFVFPILVACNLGELKNVVLQQPELHLHPALQASLADVFIETACQKKIICETHSEHMILRTLRRVRQTTTGTLVDRTLALKPEDLAFNYFEPVPDGYTKIHNLRVSEDGDFIDRWPNGFFAERDEELFGE